ncbi:MAG: ABC transporter permease [Propionibacteriaceae bacterium]|nr:ABC transporter permease [Propionibacteriaceae bacterium]
MRGFMVFCRKELTESYRSYRLVILLVVMALMGIMSPFTAMILPDILSGSDLGGGLILELPEPTSFDSWTQFFSNVSQMGMLAMILVFAGLMASELSKGTLIPVLTKGIPRGTVILAKFTVATILWSLGYAVSWIICWGYTIYYWGAQDFTHPWITFCAPWLVGELFLALMILGGTLVSNWGGSLGVVAVVVITGNLVNLLPEVRPYNPITLAAGTLGLLDGSHSVEDFTPAIAICVGAIVLCLILSIVVFKRKQL